ncbi:sarcosine oxidase subunit delta [Limibacillus halophilus]|uniref:Sarcosine oxidase subunit delta n=1 Tax=Limibacillus halophilus TaxID=1579333 RepID=A0A839SSX4_9PROT|nr:sarcosine oxidase subunit delta [Limibacillus halophilus]MBB3065418.1 sarcosine oxidase subunit delta [Limibacillus halophilus]
MLRLKCPHCGERDHSEFAYGGDAGVKMPAIDNEDFEAWYQAVFIRKNPRGRHLEYWHHVQGCREWLKVERDTMTHEIFSVAAAREVEEGAQ